MCVQIFIKISDPIWSKTYRDFHNLTLLASPFPWSKKCGVLGSVLARSSWYISVCQNFQNIPNGLNAMAISLTDHGRTDGQTDGQTEGRTDSFIKRL